MPGNIPYKLFQPLILTVTNQTEAALFNLDRIISFKLLPYRSSDDHPCNVQGYHWRKPEAKYDILPPKPNNLEEKIFKLQGSGGLE